MKCEECDNAIEKHGAAARKLTQMYNEKAVAGACQAQEVVYSQTYQKMVEVCGEGLMKLKSKYTYKGLAPSGGRG